MDITVEELETRLEKLIRPIACQMTETEKKLLLTFKSKNPDWILLGMEKVKEIVNLPSVRWKLHSLEQIRERKHKEAFEKLEKIIGNK